MMMQLVFRQSVSLSQTQRMSQRVAQSVMLRLRLALVCALREERFEPEGVCPACQKRLTPIEILKGFLSDPLDITTQCPSCGTRFNANLRWRDSYSSVLIPFICSAQTLFQLSGKQGVPVEDLKKENPGAVYSALIHFGGLQQAFRAMGEVYAHSDLPTWEHKVVPFLGNLPDTVIAKVVGTTARRIAKLRRERGVPPFTRKALQASATEQDFDS